MITAIKIPSKEAIIPISYVLKLNLSINFSLFSYASLTFKIKKFRF